MTGPTERTLLDALDELKDSLNNIAQAINRPDESVRSSETRAVAREMSMTRANLVELFTDECLARSRFDSHSVRLTLAYETYHHWCDNRRVSDVHRLAFIDFINHLTALGYPRSESPRRVTPEGLEYVIERCTLTK